MKLSSRQYVSLATEKLRLHSDGIAIKLSVELILSETG